MTEFYRVCYNDERKIPESFEPQKLFIQTTSTTSPARLKYFISNENSYWFIVLFDLTGEDLTYLKLLGVSIQHLKTERDYELFNKLYTEGYCSVDIDLYYMVRGK